MPTALLPCVRKIIHRISDFVRPQEGEHAQSEEQDCHQQCCGGRRIIAHHCSLSGPNDFCPHSPENLGTVEYVACVIVCDPEGSKSGSWPLIRQLLCSALCSISCIAVCAGLNRKCVRPATAEARLRFVKTYPLPVDYSQFPEVPQ